MTAIITFKLGTDPSQGNTRMNSHRIVKIDAILYGRYSTKFIQGYRNRIQTIDNADIENIHLEGFK